jgi:hypothetical protein
MLDKIIAILLLLAVIAVACGASLFATQDKASESYRYTVDTLVSQANQPVSPTDALAATSERINSGRASVWPTVATLFGLIVVGLFTLGFMRYGEGFLKQYRLWSKKKTHKPATTLREIPRQRPMLPSGPVSPDDVILEGEVWNQ